MCAEVILFYNQFWVNFKDLTFLQNKHLKFLKTFGQYTKTTYNKLNQAFICGICCCNRVHMLRLLATDVILLLHREPINLLTFKQLPPLRAEIYI